MSTQFDATCILEDTPVLVVDLDRLEENIRDMADFASRHSVNLRPHIKTHKTPAITRRQLAAGAVGITVAKLGEAEVMADHGIDNILVAYPLVGEVKVNRLLRLAERAKVSTVVDNLEAARFLSEKCLAAGKRLDVLIEVNSGLDRCGVEPGQDTVDFARHIVQLEGLRLVGILTHAGHAYASRSPAEVAEIGRREGQVMVETYALMRKAGLEVATVSVGSTPTARHAGAIEGVTEIRPGNYVFYDAIQVALGVVKPDRCALSVRATVISAVRPGRAIIDAGSKALGLDTGGHGTELLRGHGMVKGHPDVIISRLSEEHGFMDFDANRRTFNVGDIVEIIPNHACSVVNNFREMVGLRNGVVETTFDIAAQGRLR